LVVVDDDLFAEIMELGPETTAEDVYVGNGARAV
jgi:hypothetical protein